MFTIVCPISKCPKIQQDKNLWNFVKLQCQNNGNLKIYDFLQKLKKVVRIVLYGPAISQSDCRKAGPYQLPLIIQVIVQQILPPMLFGYWINIVFLRHFSENRQPPVFFIGFLILTLFIVNTKYPSKVLPSKLDWFPSTIEAFWENNWALMDFQCALESYVKVRT